MVLLAATLPGSKGFVLGFITGGVATDLTDPARGRSQPRPHSACAPHRVRDFVPRAMLSYTVPE